MTISNRPLDFPRSNWAWSRHTGGISDKQQQARRQLVRGAVGVTRGWAALEVTFVRLPRRPQVLGPVGGLLAMRSLNRFLHSLRSVEMTPGAGPRADQRGERGV